MARIFLIGPGGVGKTVAGGELARLLDCAFFDLDQQFMARVGHIDAVIGDQGYGRYVELNAELFATLAEELPATCVIAAIIRKGEVIAAFDGAIYDDDFEPWTDDMYNHAIQFGKAIWRD